MFKWKYIDPVALFVTNKMSDYLSGRKFAEHLLTYGLDSAS